MKKKFTNYRRGNAILFLSFLLLCLGMSRQNLRAQIVTNTFSQYLFYTMPSGYAVPTTVNDVNTNCDMLQDPAGAIETLKFVKQ